MHYSFSMPIPTNPEQTPSTQPQDTETSNKTPNRRYGGTQPKFPQQLFEGKELT
jgi:hypothetical protein